MNCFSVFFYLNHYNLKENENSKNKQNKLKFCDLNKKTNKIIEKGNIAKMSALAKCVVCDDNDQETNINPIFLCEDCNIGVHKLCYGVTASSGVVDPWWCSPCSIGQTGAICELCLQSGGALKKTTCNRWVHVICALFIEGMVFKNKIRMEPVDISNVLGNNRDKKCVYCLKNCGVFCKCSERNCDHFLHVTCGQKHKSLKENTNPKNNKIIFEAFCREHKPKESSRRISSVFVAGKLAESNEDIQPDQNDNDVIEAAEISSNDSHESDAGNGVSDGVNISNNEDKSDANEASTEKDDIDETESNHFSGRFGAGLSPITFTHSSIINYDITSTTNDHNTKSDADESNGARPYWWDYMELRLREEELDAQLKSRDDIIATVIILNMIILN